MALGATRVSLLKPRTQITPALHFDALPFPRFVRVRITQSNFFRMPFFPINELREEYFSVFLGQTIQSEKNSD